MDKFERIKKECFWEYDLYEDFLRNVGNINDFKIKKFVFEKILLNSSRLFEDLSIFSKEDIEKIWFSFIF